MQGLFVPDGGDLGGTQFYVFESAVGSIDKGMPLLKRLGASSLSWAAVYIYDHEDLPGCGPGSSSSEYGHGTMFFSEGELWLELTSGFSCVVFPNVDLYATYEIVGGTGLFEDAEGSLEVRLDGTIVTSADPNTMTAQFEGKVRLDDYDD